MPKLNVNTSVAVTQAAIQKELSEIENLLQGLLADDNLLENDSGDKIKIQGKSVAGFPDSARPLSTTMKLIGGDDFSSNIWDKLYSAFLKNKEYTFVEATNGWSIDNTRTGLADTASLESTSTQQYKDYATLGGLFKKRFVFNKTLNMKPLTINDIINDENSPFIGTKAESTLLDFKNRDEYIYSVTFDSENNFTDKILGASIESVADLDYETVVDVNIVVDPDLSDSSFFAMSMNITMLFEVLK